MRSLRGLALAVLAGAVGVLCVGCGGAGEPTTIDLSGQLEIKQLAGAASPADREALQAALVRSIQKRTPSDVRVVFNGAGATGTTGEQGAEGGGRGPASADTCGFLPDLCEPASLAATFQDALKDPALPSGLTQRSSQSSSSQSGSSQSGSSQNGSSQSGSSQSGSSQNQEEKSTPSQNGSSENDRPPGNPPINDDFTPGDPSEDGRPPGNLPPINDDFVPGGSSFEFEPGLVVECTQAVEQAAAASSGVVVPVLPFGVVVPIATDGGLLAQIFAGGEVQQSFEAGAGGDAATQCANPQQFGITGFEVAVAGVEAKVFAAPNGKTFALIEDLPGSAKPPAPDPSAKPTTDNDAPSETSENLAGASETPEESPPDEEAPSTDEEAPSDGGEAPPTTDEAPPTTEEAPPASEGSPSGGDSGGG